MKIVFAKTVKAMIEAEVAEMLMLMMLLAVAVAVVAVVVVVMKLGDLISDHVLIS